MFHFGDDLENRLPHGEKAVMTDKQFIEREISRFKASKRRKDMLTGERYYSGKHDILFRKRTVIGEGGELTEVKNLPNHRIVDNQYEKMVDQKTNYLLGQPITFQGENKDYLKALSDFFNMRFMRLMKTVGEDALNEGICWLYPCYDENGEFVIRKFKGHEIIAGWKDAEHTILEYAIRVYAMISYEGETERIIEKVEVYDDAGVHYFQLDNNTLTPEEPFEQPYFVVDGVYPFNWSKIPLIPFKRNSAEKPLICNVKSLQDGVNLILSNFLNSMEEDARNTILILVNYDGENLGEFRRNLAQYGAVKVKTVDGAAGDLRTLQVEVNSENYKTILEIFKKAIIENAKGFDAKDDRMQGEPNQMNIQSMYSDIDLDANNMETEFQAGFEELLWFLNCHFSNTGIGNFESEEVTVIFNRDILINETEAINNVRNSIGILSDETLVAQHPWVDDPQAELKRLKKQRAEEAEDGYLNNFPKGGNDPGGDK